MLLSHNCSPLVLLFYTYSLLAQQNLKICRYKVDITQDQTVSIAGQFHARVSEGVLDPVTAGEDSLTSEKVVFVSCDLLGISDGNRNEPNNNLLSTVRRKIVSNVPVLREKDIILHATHSHSASYCGKETDIAGCYGVNLEAISPYDNLRFAATRIADAVVHA